MVIKGRSNSNILVARNQHGALPAHLPATAFPGPPRHSPQVMQQPSVMTVGGLDYGPNPRTGESGTNIDLSRQV